MRRLVIPHRKASVEGPFDRPSVMPFNSPGPIFRTLVGHNFPLHAVFPHPIYRPPPIFVLPIDRSFLRFAAVVRLSLSFDGPKLSSFQCGSACLCSLRSSPRTRGTTSTPSAAAPTASLRRALGKPRQSAEKRRNRLRQQDAKIITQLKGQLSSVRECLKVGLGAGGNGGAILSLLTIAQLPPGHDPGAVAGGAPAARQRGLRPCDIMVLGVNQVGTEAPEAPTGDKRYRAE